MPSHLHRGACPWGLPLYNALPCSIFLEALLCTYSHFPCLLSDMGLPPAPESQALNALQSLLITAIVTKHHH